MIFITGDTHRELDIHTINPREFVEGRTLTRDDYVIICGDFGCIWDGGSGDRFWLNWLESEGWNTLFIDGNHENFDKLNSYPVETWRGGKVHKIRRNIIHLMRGEVYCVEENTIFVMGGGYSIDKYRRTEGVSWWRREMPSEEEYHNAIMNLERVGNHVDYIITHTAPSETVYYLSTLRSLGIKNDVVQEQPLTSFLDEIQRKTTYKQWYFGHFHVDKELWRNQTALLNSVRELETGKVVRQWDLYEG